MRCGLLSIDISLHDAILVDTNGCKQIESALVARINTVEDQADHDLLPCWTTLVPELGLLKVHDVADVLHYTMQSTSCEHLVFVVCSNGNQKLSVSVVHRRPQIVAILECEVVWIAVRRRV